MKKGVVVAVAVLLVALTVGLVVIAPRRVDSGLYSAVNENRAGVTGGMYAVNLSFREDGSGFVSLSDGKSSVDVINFTSHSVFLGRLTLQGTSAASGSETGDSLEFSVRLTDGGFSLNNCRYELVKSFI